MQTVIEGYSLSPQQRRLIAHLPGSGSYRCRALVDIEGSLDAVRLRDAALSVLTRHEILRTAYHAVPGSDDFVQAIEDEGRLQFDTLDLGDARTAVRSGGLYDSLLPDDFALGEIAPLRLTLIRRADDRHVLTISLPSVASDRVSAVCLWRDIVDAYADETPDTPKHEVVQYADFAEWRNGQMREATQAFSQAREIAANVRPFVFGLERSSVPDGGWQRARLDIDVDQIRKLESALRCGSRTILLAAWAAVLWRFGGGEAFPLEVRADGRPGVALAQALGPFEEYASMIVAASDDTSFTELLRWIDVDGKAADGPSSGTESHVRGGVGFSFLDVPEPITGRGARFELRDVEARSEGFKLELDCRCRWNACRVDICFDSSIYDASVATSLRDAFTAVIDHVETGGDTVLGALPLVTTASRSNFAAQRAPSSRLGDPTTFVEIFDQQVARLPAAIAVRCGAGALTYAELDDLTARLARRLVVSGVAPGHVVGVMLARSVEAIVGILAILKCGATFLPLDTGLPTRRLAFFLLQAAAGRLLTTRDLVRPELIEGRSVVYYEDDESAGTPQLADVVLPTVDPTEAAYVVFTSGSTGEPKGVVVEHRQLMNYVRAAITDLELDGMRSFATVSTMAADLGHTAIFPALATGAALHVIPQEVAADASDLAAYFARHEVDVLKIVPSHFAALVAGLPDPSQIFPRCRLILGGETITLGMMRVFRSYAGECRVFNHYGPTETTVGVVAGDTERTMGSVFCKSVPLGAPLASAAVHILDAGLRPVPDGVTAEIFVGGTSLARGYVGRPDLTADRFLPDPISGQDGSRIYRTGDLGRRLPDGSLEWMGRVDRQVKIRGFRVELTEIEALLGLCPGVRQAVVSLNGEVEYQRIIAYVVRSDATIASASDMQASLAEKLPDYMLPAAILFLDDIPLTSNGKIDYRALPDPDRYAAVADRPIADPRTLAEHLVATIFMALLGTSSVGIHDDFFEIGGHSLLATRLLAKLRSAFGIDMSLRAIFEGSSIAALAAAAEQGDDVAVEAESDVLPMSPDIPNAPTSESGRVHGLSLWLNGLLDDGTLRSAIADCAQRHDIMQSRLECSGDANEPHRSGDEYHIDLVVRAASTGPTGDVDELAAVSWARALSSPFSRDAGALWRFGIFHLAADRHLLQIVADSSVADATSLELIVENIALCLEPGGRASDILFEPSNSFAATRFSKASSGDDSMPASIAYWRRHLGRLADRAKASPGSSISSDQPIIVSIERSELVEFERLARRFLVTLPLLFLSAWSAAVAEETNRDDVLVLVGRGGRPRSDELGCVGPFAEAYPLRLQWSDDKSFADLLDKTRIAAVRATLHHPLALQTILFRLDGADVDFDAGFSFVAPPKITKLGGATVERMTPIEGNHDVQAAAVLRVTVTVDGLECRIETRGVACHATELARRWRSVLDCIAADCVASNEIEHA